jgi:predicted dehydrogenase
LTALNAQRKFGFSTVTTDAEEVLGDDSLDAVFVVTRHHSHASFVVDALERGGGGRAVFVEKPLALTSEQTDDVLAAVERTGNDRVMVGFNRRFAPMLVELQDRFGRPGSVRGALAARYLINAGRLENSSWYLNAEREGSRFAGEGGHFVDTVSALVGQDPVEVSAVGGGDDVQAVFRYPDGSTAVISYLSGGHPRFGKESIDLTGAGRSARLDNFQRVTVFTPNGKHTKRSLTGIDKGQRAQLAAFVEAVRSGGPMPIGLDSLVATTRATLAVGTSLAEQRPVTW